MNTFEVCTVRDKTREQRVGDAILTAPDQNVGRDLSRRLRPASISSVGMTSRRSSPRDDDAVSVGHVLDLFVQHWGAGRWQAESCFNGPHEARLLRLDSSKAREQLGCRQALELSEAVRWTADWYREAAAGMTDLRDLTCRQLEEYEIKAGAAPSPRVWLRPVVAQSHAA